MPRNAKSLCRHCGLTYVETADLRLLRRRCGKGFSYIDEEGRAIRDKAVKARIKRLAIPPAWTEVRIAEDERAHIQAVGRDGEGRLQYRYHDDWEKARTETKLHRLLRLGSALPRLRDAVRQALAASRERKLSRQSYASSIARCCDRVMKSMRARRDRAAPRPCLNVTLS
jgi:DNA topoisomerase I